jgi:hypothetical protein
LARQIGQRRDAPPWRLSAREPSHVRASVQPIPACVITAISRAVGAQASFQFEVEFPVTLDRGSRLPRAGPSPPGRRARRDHEAGVPRLVQSSERGHWSRSGDCSLTPEAAAQRCQRWPPDRGPDRSYLVAALRWLEKSRSVASDGRFSGKPTVSRQPDGLIEMHQEQAHGPSDARDSIADGGSVSGAQPQIAGFRPSQRCARVWSALPLGRNKQIPFGGAICSAADPAVLAYGDGDRCEEDYAAP